MADYEVSKLMWIGIVVALATSVFTIAQPQISSLTNGALNTVSKVVNPSNSDNGGSTVTKIDSNDAKWVEKGNYGTNGYFVRDKDGNGIVYALDPQQPVIAPETAIYTTSNENLTSLRFLDKTILPKNSNYYFAGNIKLKTFDTKNLDTSNVTYMRGMFVSMDVTALDVSNFDTSNVTNMNSMFAGMSALTTLDVSKFDTSKVTDMGDMFGGMQSLTSLDVSKFDTSKVTDMGGMFFDMQSLSSLDVSKFDTSKVTRMDSMFDGSSALTALDVSNFNTSNVTEVAYMFGDRYKDGHKLTPPDTSKFNTSKMTDVDQMFDDRPLIE